MRTKAKLPESIWREDVERAMRGLWVMTRHENQGKVKSGCPDFSYVMGGLSFETGWLELKAERDTGPTAQFHVEPSQHRWIKEHCYRVPVHFLLSWGNFWYLLDGAWHHKLVHRVTRPYLQGLCRIYGDSSTLRDNLNKNLKELTSRHGIS